jgi:hypothetical protein
MYWKGEKETMMMMMIMEEQKTKNDKIKPTINTVVAA